MSKLDEWLGRAPLKERIDELETETERLRSRLEAESDRRADAVRARQEAEERVNRLEDRIAQLEGELERVEDGNGPDLRVRRRERLRGGRIADVLDVLESVRTAPEGALTATVAPAGVTSGVDHGDGSDSAGESHRADDLPPSITELLGDRTALLDGSAPCLFCADDAGLVTVALSPPILPAVEPTWDDRFHLDRSAFLPSAAGRYALALVRADLFAVGVYDGEERVASRGFESEVKGSHSKGGFSQARFDRIRDDQIDGHLERCGETIEDFLADPPGGEPVDRLFLVGQSGPVDAVVTESSVDPAATATVDATGAPEAALEDAAHSFWTTTLHVL